MRLGCWMPFSAWPQLKQRRMPVDTALALDDPFLAPDSLVSRAPASQPMTASEYDALLSNQYEALPSTLKSFMDYEYFRAQAETKKQAIMAAQASDAAWPTVDYKRYRALSVVRFFRYESISLWHWALLGGQHRFMLWVFELDEARVHAWMKPRPYKWAEVRYQEARPRKEGALDFDHLFVQPELFAPLDEVRLVFPKVPSSKGLPLPLFALKAIHLGARMPQIERQVVMQTCQQLPDWQHCVLYQNRLQRERFRLEASENTLNPSVIPAGFAAS